MAHGFLVPKPRIESRSLTVKASSPNHWTTREFPLKCIFEKYMSDILNIYKELLIICTIVPSLASYLSSSFYFFPIKLRVKTKL